MILDSSALNSLQKCPRRWKLERSFRQARWAPKALFDACLRKAVLELSSGSPKELVTKSARTRYLTIAGDPGLDTLSDPWTLANDFCAMLSTVIERLSREVLLKVNPGLTVDLGSEVQWRVLSFLDDSGLLHRWQSVERLDSDTLSRELHSWSVFGDLAVLDAPMTLHLLEIGSTRNGRRHSPWARAYRHPVIPGKFKFQSKSGEALAGSQWKPFFFADSSDQDQKSWVDLMEKDSLVLVHHLEVKQLSPAQAQEGKRQILLEASRARDLPSWENLPLSRPACDWPILCAWQNVCYAPEIPDLISFPGLRVVESERARAEPGLKV